MPKILNLSMLRNQRGVSVIIVAIVLVVLIGFAALAVDLAYLFAARNELQNAADAGALAGAAALYRDTLGESVDENANTIGYHAATQNRSQKEAVELYDYEDNDCVEGEDVQRGHWSFGLTPEVLARGFTCNDSTEIIDLWDYTSEQLDADTDFINAVKVVTRRSGTPVWCFFARIFGFESFQLSADAVAYIGFASLFTGVDLPIAICEDTIIGDLDTGEISCTLGRMFNANNDTARWTTLGADWEGGVVDDLVDATCGNTEGQILSEPVIGTTEGQVNDAFRALYNCWKMNALNEIVKEGVDEDEDGVDDTVDIPIDKDEDCFPDQPWTRTLPVIDCTEGPTSGTVRGLVEISIIWMALKDQIDGENDNDCDHPAKELGAPQKMYYDIPTYDPVNGDENDMVYGGYWPDNAPPGGGTDPEDEVINAGDPSVYEIMQSFPDFDNIERDILRDHPELEDPDGWPEDSPPRWTNETVEDLFDYGAVRWASLVKHFNMRDMDGETFADYEMMTIYFIPTCTIVPASGSSGPDNFGILAEFPVLVE